jgi:hypothetical protein
MQILDTQESIDVDTASPEQMRRVAQRYRQEAAATAARYSWAARYAPAAPPAPELSVRDLLPNGGYARADDPPFDREAFDANLRRAKALVEIEMALEKAAADAARAAQAAKDEAAAAFRQTAIGGLFRGR